MNADLAYFLAAACILAAVYGFWHSSLGAREAANRIAREACSRAVVQLLDGTVAFAGFRLGRDAGEAAHAAAHLHLRLHERRLRALAGLHRDGRPESQGGRTRGHALMSDEAGIDLHTHSHCSDGSLAPGELVERAAAAGVRMLALTDHDTLAGLARSARGSRAGGYPPGTRGRDLRVLAPPVDPRARALDRPRLIRAWGCARGPGGATPRADAPHVRRIEQVAAAGR